MKPLLSRPAFCAASMTSLVLVATVLGVNPAFGCTHDEAFNKMMALGRAQQKMMNEAGSHGPAMLRAADFAKEVGGVGQTLADKKYAEACARYDAIAKKYGVSLEQEAKGMVSMEEIRRDGGKRGGKCSQSDAAMKMVEATQQLDDKAANGEIDRSIITLFGNEMQKHNDLIMSDPSAYCDKLEEAKKRFGIK